MNNKSLIATILFAVFTFPQIFGCAGTEFGRAVEAGMGTDGYQVATSLGARNKSVYLARMALSKDAAVIMPGMKYARLSSNPLNVRIVMEHSYLGTDYTVIRSNLPDGTAVGSLVIIPSQGINTKA